MCRQGTGLSGLRFLDMNAKDSTPPRVSTPTPTSDGRLGGREALPPGSLPKPYLGPQGDENRTPPPNAPSPVGGTETIESGRRRAEEGKPDKR